MIFTRQIGDALVTNVIEYYGPTHDPYALCPDLTAEMLDRHRAWLSPAHWFDTIGRLVVTIQIWIVRVGDEVIVIDTGVGNHKPRSTKRMHMLNTLVPEWMAAAGVPFAAVTHVVMTHLHTDHVGWNTVRSGDEWVPTFPNARYLLPETDLKYFRGQYEKDPVANASVADSIEPIIEAGLVDFIEAGATIAGGLRVTAAAGHTPGMLNLWIGEGERQGVFCADIFHTPLQIAEPQLNTAFCVLPDEAKATRRAFLERVADTPTLIMPCHFGPPHCGTVARQGDSFAFLPEPQDKRRVG
jgi:glyoxylase-like metal-dependent hydrolase (beta-lactamase superfamily II)